MKKTSMSSQGGSKKVSMNIKDTKVSSSDTPTKSDLEKVAGSIKTSNKKKPGTFSDCDCYCPCSDCDCYRPCSDCDCYCPCSDCDCYCPCSDCDSYLGDGNLNQHPTSTVIMLRQIEERLQELESLYISRFNELRQMVKNVSKGQARLERSQYLVNNKFGDITKILHQVSRKEVKRTTPIKKKGVI